MKYRYRFPNGGPDITVSEEVSLLPEFETFFNAMWKQFGLPLREKAGLESDELPAYPTASISNSEPS